jgi:exonuclease III
MGAGWRQIDFICTYPKGAFEVKKLTFVENLLASDHRPVVAELLYRNA